MSTSSEEDSLTATAPRLYRLQNLELASVFIHRMSTAQAPLGALSLAATLTSCHFREVLDDSEVKSLLQEDEVRVSHMSHITNCLRREGKKAPDGSSAALSAAMRLRAGAAGCYGKTKSHWLDFAQDMLADLRYSDVLQYSKYDEPWDEAWGVFMAETYPLSTPQPDYGFGLRSQPPCSVNGPNGQSTPPALSQESLWPLKLQLTTPPCPSPDLPEIIYPCLIVQVGSQVDPLFFTQNHAAGAAVKALSMIESLEGCYRKTVKKEKEDEEETHRGPLPVLAICTQGAMWEFSIAFRLHEKESSPSNGKHPMPGVHLVRIWNGNVDEASGLYQAQFLLQRTLLWIKTVYRPRIEAMLNAIRQTL
ncbi:hypothetical protein BCV69DRAFT_301018 [Microstroma glucosiphilum]|uniref:Uncharacterized protein n=1 Tax=Pseudomicrostroma glucosiphilum TaxID=1684307 RepID=A0A316U7E2_9BASI|nr:hypothetical protein BCV69DRAFT_301018 [Pseudomicrostroma glucosiphilum]PWN18865.1 hypothetical protein BCV69DRAFT_301018 [Pseudomicrostroma glucosiphilum]